LTLRRKTLLIISATTFSLILVLYIATQTILLDSFAKLERQFARQTIERAMKVVSEEIAALDETVYDQAAQDEAYDFVEQLSDEYIQSNLADENLIRLGVSLILFVDDSGQIVFGRGFDLHNGRQVPVPQSLQVHFAENDLLLRHADLENSVSGLLLLPEGPLLVASRPILTSEREGPIRGTLIMGRYLDSIALERLAESVRLSLTLRRFDDSQMSSDFQVARSSFLGRAPSERAPVFVQPLGIESVAGYGLLRNIYGEPCLILRADIPREIYKQGQSTALYSISALLGVSLVFGLMTLLLLEKIILSRLTQLSESVGRIGASGDLSARVSATGKDELSGLAEAINKMLTALEQSQDELRESEQRFRDVARTTGDWIWETDAEGRYTYVSPVVAQVLGYTPAEVVDRHYVDFLHPSARERLGTQVPEFIREQRAAVRLASPAVHKDGHEVILETSALPLTDPAGNLLGYRGVHRDVTSERRLRERLDAVHTLGRELVLSRDEQQVAEIAIDAARLLLQGQHCDLWLVDKEKKVLSGWVVRAPGQVVDNITMPLEDDASPIATVVGTGESIYLPAVQDDPHSVDSDAEIRSELYAPLRLGERIIGVLNIGNEEQDAFDQEEQQLLLTLADQTALAIENARLYKEMRVAHDRLQTLSRRLVEVQEAERRHLACELHDEIGQILTGLKLILKMSKRLPADAIEASLGEARELVDELMAQVRNLSLDLRPTMLDDLGLLPALLWHCERYTSQTGRHVAFKHIGLERRRFPPEVETAAYRIVQEALTNVARHAGASEVTVRLWADQDVLGVQVEDQGVGFDPEAALDAGTTGGLSGMHERAVLLGGQLTIESASETGTRVTAEFPLAASPPASSSMNSLASTTEQVGESAESEGRSQYVHDHHVGG